VLWTEWRCSAVLPASVVQVAAAPEAAEAAVTACRGRQLISILAEAADVGPKLLDRAGKSAHSVLAELDEPDCQASGREPARQGQDAQALGIQEPGLEERAEPE
jgi:hypothetical protein